MWNYNIVNERIIEVSNSNYSFIELLSLSEAFKKIEGIEESYPLKSSMIVIFDPCITTPDLILEKAKNQDLKLILKSSSRKIIEIPICYDNQFCLDKTFLEEYYSLTFDQIVSIHLDKLYHLEMFGFIPGFFYLSGLSERLKIPRKATPVIRVPKGSVAIAHEYTGVYPSESAGGWYVIGKTPISFFDLKNRPYFNIQVGDQFKFFSISKEEFEAYEQ
jgi:inhibitor of KinA